MFQDILSNLGMLLLIFLLSATLTNFKWTKSFSPSLTAFLLILIYTVGTIGMGMYPIELKGHNFSLCMIPIMMITLLNGWKYGVAVAILASPYWFFTDEANLYNVFFFSLLIPVLLVHFFSKGKSNIFHFKHLFLITTMCFLVSEIPMVHHHIMDNDFKYIYMLVDCLAVLLLSFIMYFFMIESTKNLDLERELELLAERDPLTGLYNMRKFEEVLVNNQSVYNRQFVAMLDIDFFKRINDCYGHQVGDIIIQNVAAIIKKHTNEDIIAARYGGDEYIMLLMNMAKSEAVLCLENIRKEVEMTNFLPNVANIKDKIKLSIGVAQLKHNKNFTETFLEADRFLYESKNKGRNQICG